MSESARQRAVLSHLLAQPTELDRRPCRGCVTPCQCARKSSSCCCGCSASCAVAPTALSHHRARRPVHPAYVPVLYELSALRLIEPWWPDDAHYCGPTGQQPPRPVHFRTTVVEYAGLVAHHLRHLGDVGALSAKWHVSVVAHLACPGETNFAIESLDATIETHRVLWTDLFEIGSKLASIVRHIACVRLRILDVHTSPVTQREREVLDLFLTGLGVETISARLFISPHTVRNHMKRLFAKFCVTSQTELREQFIGSPQ